MNIKNESKILMIQLQQVRRELEKCPPGKLDREVRGNGIRYVHVFKAGGKHIRKGITRNADMIRKLARKKYLETLCEFIEREINVISNYEKDHVEINADLVLDHLPDLYKGLPEEYFLNSSFETDGIVSGEEKSSKDIVRMVKSVEALRLWENAAYERATYREDEKKHTTTRGLKVRSKSEMLIAQILYGFDDMLAFRYEEVVYIGERKIIPDFVIMTKNGKKYYWEHAGLINNPEYLRRHMQKLELYARAGITMWNNLIVTYDDAEGNLDATIIEGLIRTIILKEG
ncbi:MAG: hypothetical protein IJP24_05665 [Firmicutes bacterium]|nr:hypothetical protein [Bacillota bacterium]MBQ9972996.1 hypothetical protein [Bacillota bacterium]